MIFAIELETLARRAFIDIDPLIQLQMVRDRFIDGQAECALRRHLVSSKVGSDICVVPDVLQTSESVRTVVAEEWMDWFVLDLVESPSVSGTSTVARTFGPAMSEEYSPVVLAGGGGEVADAYPLIVVESDTAQVSDLPMVESDTARVSVLPLAGCKFPAVFLGKVALDVVSLGVGPPCLRVDSEETLLILMDERAQLVCAAPGVTPEDGSEEGAPVLELIEHSVLGKSLVDGLQEPMPAMKRLKRQSQYGSHLNICIVLCLKTWTLILSGWGRGTPAGRVIFW